MIHAICTWLEAHPVALFAGLGLVVDDLAGVATVVVRHVRRRRAMRTLRGPRAV